MGLDSKQVCPDGFLGLLSHLGNAPQARLQQDRLPSGEKFTRRLGLQMHCRQQLTDTVMKLARQQLAFLEHGQGPLMIQELHLGSSLPGNIVEPNQMPKVETPPIDERRQGDLKPTGVGFPEGYFPLRCGCIADQGQEIGISMQNLCNLAADNL